MSAKGRRRSTPRLDAYTQVAGTSRTTVEPGDSIPVTGVKAQVGFVRRAVHREGHQRWRTQSALRGRRAQGARAAQRVQQDVRGSLISRPRVQFRQFVQLRGAARRAWSGCYDGCCACSTFARHSSFSRPARSRRVRRRIRFTRLRRRRRHSRCSTGTRWVLNRSALRFRYSYTASIPTARMRT